MRVTLFAPLAAALLSFACGPSALPSSSPSPSAAPQPSPSPAPSAPSAPAASVDPAHAPLVRIGDIASPPHFDVTATLNDLVLPQLTSCYADALAAAPGLHGKMLVSFEVNEQGGVTSATEAKSTTNNAPLFACIKAALIATMFPKPPGVATVNMPLVFRP